MQPVFLVYWCDIADDQLVPRATRFAANAMSEALQYAEALRRRQSNGEAIRFVTLCSENPDAVGPAGVADPPADYAWRKRRP